MEEAIVNAFPVWSRAPRDLTNAVNRVLLLRNRVAHLEPLLNTNNVQAQLTNMRIVLEAVDPLLAQWAMGWQRITATIRARPV
ncbi:hypothetical protein GCM10025864_16860 [Luteimicrobium album]|uniref:RiboL-PSP-HEPN domain-containing protein n=1 Tax=Luteimicrobium album TaxID=1054550 RepID=A0ABQ6I131_9MICO|nr:hypothetical protein [Luteimicrobium album]GMA23927.1 hypothetical protein GCM10025864_16860 [Luteimicrobium album]